MQPLAAAARRTQRLFFLDPAFVERLAKASAAALVLRLPAVALRDSLQVDFLDPEGMRAGSGKALAAVALLWLRRPRSSLALRLQALWRLLDRLPTAAALRKPAAALQAALRDSLELDFLDPASAPETSPAEAAVALLWLRRPRSSLALRLWALRELLDRLPTAAALRKPAVALRQRDSLEVDFLDPASAPETSPAEAAVALLWLRRPRSSLALRPWALRELLDRLNRLPTAAALRKPAVALCDSLEVDFLDPASAPGASLPEGMRAGSGKALAAVALLWLRRPRSSLALRLWALRELLDRLPTAAVLRMPAVALRHSLEVDFLDPAPAPGPATSLAEAEAAEGMRSGSGTALSAAALLWLLRSSLILLLLLGLLCRRACVLVLGRLWLRLRCFGCVVLVRRLHCGCGPCGNCWIGCQRLLC